MRVSKVRAFNGTLHVVPNGELTRFGNQSRGYMRAIVVLDLAYEQDADKGMVLAREAAGQWYKESADNAVEPPVVAGLLKFGEAGVQVRVSVKVRPGRQWDAEQQLRLRLKQAFDSSGTEPPFPRRVVYLRSDSEAGPQPKP
jgi:small conductance mechanosensitive channel